MNGFPYGGGMNEGKLDAFRQRGRLGWVSRPDSLPLNTGGTLGWCFISKPFKCSQFLLTLYTMGFLMFT